MIRCRIERGRWLLFSIFLLVLLSLTGCSPKGGGLLAGLSPSLEQEVDRATKLTDARVSKVGEDWNTNQTAIFKGPRARVVYDLGTPRALRSGWILADNDDTYVVSVSDDGKTFRPAWEAKAERGHGLRPRTGTFEASGRYVQVQATGGDGNHSISEVQLFEDAAIRGPVGVKVVASRQPHEVARTSVLHLGLALVTLLLLSRPGRRPWWLLGVGAVGVAALGVAEAFPDIWPVDGREVSLVRGIVASVAAFVLAWDAFSPRNVAPDRRVATGILGVCGLLGLLSFYNLGRPQFWDDKTKTPSFVHYLDLRQYHPTAKFFPEIGYRRLYEADTAAFLEETQTPFDRIASKEMRNLDTNMVGRIGDRRAEIKAIKGKFSPERWAEYKQDARYFRLTMGQETWFKMMLDLGGNATPVWMANAYLLFNIVPVNDDSFFRVALLDALLIVLMFVAIGRTFGARTAFLCMVLFGTNDFIMFGTNWGGAIFRHDWLVCLGFGVCALATRRPMLAGALFATAASFRAFPGLALVGVLIPPSWALLEGAWSRRALPSLDEAREIFRPTWPVMLGAGVALSLLFTYSCVVLSPGAWKDWYAKIGILHADAHINTVSLQALLAGETVRPSVIAARRPLILAATLLFSAAIALVARKKPLHQGAIAALLLLPVWMNPSNYYMHLVCLFPMMVADPLCSSKRGDGPIPFFRSDDDAPVRVVLILLVMCASHYLAVLVQDRHIRFYQLSASLVVGMAALLHVLLRRDGPDALAALTSPPAPVNQPEDDEDDEQDEKDNAEA